MLCGRVEVGMWNRKHNSGQKISAHSFTRNWKTVNLPIKVHPSENYCDSGGLSCQYLRYKDAEHTKPYCAWNLEYRGSLYREKRPLQKDDKSGHILKAHFCRGLGNAYYSDTNTWENTHTTENPE